MNTIPAYIINLPTSSVRKKYMEELLAPYEFFDPQFIEAIDGRELSNSEIEQQFNSDKCLKCYGRHLNAGEIGCVLSHRKCYETLIESDNDYALILEDDIHPVGDLSSICNLPLDDILNPAKPTILFLSGDFWFYNSTGNIANVYDAVGAYAYIINKTAARIILDRIPTPYNVSDNWIVYRKLGISLKAMRPYLIDANVDMELLGSDVKQNSWSNNRKIMSKPEVVKSIYRGLIRRFLKAIGHFESKIRIIDNRVVD